MRVLVLGANGQLGRALRTTLPASGTHEVIFAGRAEADLQEPASLMAALDRVQPQVVVNAAAYTAVDRAESEPDLAFRVNAEAPALLAREAARRGMGLLHFSTDYVFDGTKPGPYVEDDAPAPLSVYGRSKLEGEQAVLASGAAALVFRTTWVYHDEGANFLKTMLKLAMEREQLRVVGDQRGAPTWAGQLADLVQQVLADADPVVRMAQASGLYHASAAGQTSWADYARFVVSVAAAHPTGRARLRLGPDDVVGISTADWPTAARRPSNSVLDNTRLAQRLGVRFPDWSEDVRRCVERLLDDGLHATGATNH